MKKSYWVVIAAVLIIAGGAAYIAFDTKPNAAIEEEVTEAGKVFVCPYYFDAMEHIVTAHIIQFGNWTKSLNITDRYTVPG